MLIIGITGPIAAGKSTVDGMLRDLGADPIVDGDLVVHELYRTSRPLRDALTSVFGLSIRADDGAIDRRVLGARVFGDPAALRQLEEIVHPATREEVRARIAEARPDAVAVVDAVKLLYGDLSDLCTERWWVAVDPTEERRRLIEERGFTPDEADRRLAAQPRLEDWRHKIDRVIDNSGPLVDTRRQVEEAWHGLVDQVDYR